MYLKKLKITSSVPNKWCVSGLGFSFALKNSKFSMYKWFPKIHLPFELNFNFLDRLDDNWVTVVSFLQSLWKCVIWIWEFEFNKILYMTVAELLWIPVAKILAQFDIIYPRYCLYLLLPLWPCSRGDKTPFSSALILPVVKMSVKLDYI